MSKVMYKQLWTNKKNESDGPRTYFGWLNKKGNSQGSGENWIPLKKFRQNEFFFFTLKGYWLREKKSPACRQTL